MKSISLGTVPEITADFAGEGPLVLFLHGIGGNRQNWTGQIEALAKSWQAVAWDMRGYGGSGDYDGPLRLDDVCADLNRVIDHFRADRTHIVGLSMGGMVALEFYRRFPDRVGSLLLSNTNAGVGVDFTAEQKAEFIRLRKTPLLQGKTPADIIPGMLQVLLGANPTSSAVENIKKSLSMLRKDSYIKAIEAVIDIDCSDVLPSINVPTRLIGGTMDKVTPLATMQTMRGRIAGAELDILEDTGHLSNLERPEKFNEILLNFLTSAEQGNARWKI